MSQEGTR